jgi:small subunit ribosomal protein S16
MFGEIGVTLAGGGDPLPELNRHSLLLECIDIDRDHSISTASAEVILLSIRLTRMGAKKKPFYRIVVTEKRSKRDGRFVESIGYYDPCRKPADVKIDRERVSYWMERGAQPSETVRSLMKRKAEIPDAGTGA